MVNLPKTCNVMKECFSGFQSRYAMGTDQALRCAAALRPHSVMKKIMMMLMRVKVNNKMEIIYIYNY